MKRLVFVLLVILCMFTLAKATTLLNEGFETSVPPPQWDTVTVVDSDNDAEWSQVSSGSSPSCSPHMDSYMAKFNSYDCDDGDEVRLVTDTFDLSGKSTCRLEFWMYTWSYSGYDDSIVVEIDTNASNNWIRETAFTGNTGTAEWSKKEVNLDSYVGYPNVRVGIKAKSDYGYHIYIDDVKIYSLNTNDIGVTGFVKSANYEEGKSDSIGLVVENLGTASQNNFWLHYDLKTDPGRDSSYYTSTLSSMALDTVFINWTPQTAGGDSITGWSILSGDEDTGNDTSKTFVTILEVGVILSEGFESPGFPPPGWCMFEKSETSQDPWQKFDYLPFDGDSSARSRYYAAGGTDYWLVSRRLYLAGCNTITLKFYHKPAYNDDTNYLKVTTQADSTDTSGYTILQEITQSSTTWDSLEVDLSAYADDTIFIAWNAKEASSYEYWYLDNVLVTADTALNCDVKVFSINSPPKFVMNENSYTPKATVKNIGKNEGTFKTFCEVDSSGTIVFTDSVQVNNLSPFSSQNVNFSPWTSSTAGLSYLFTFYTALSNDGNRSNDTLEKSVAVVGRLEVESIHPSWPGFMRDRANTGRTDCRGPTSPGTPSSYLTGGAISSSPVIASDGTVYFGSDDYYLYAMEPDLSNYKWRYSTSPDVIRSTPAIDTSGNIYFGSNDNYFHSLDSTGTFRWSRDMLANVTQPAVIGEDQRIYIGASATFYALNPDNSASWQLSPLAGNLSTGAALRDTIAYFGTSNNHRLYAATNGSMRWMKWLDRGINSIPTLKGDTIYFALNDGKLYALRDTGTGYQDLWATRIDPEAEGLNIYYSSPAIGFDHTIYVGTPYNHLVAVYPDGEIKWKFEVKDKVESSPIIDSAGVIYFGSNDDTLYAIIDSGSYAVVKWKYGTGGNIKSTPAMCNPFYFTSYDARIYRMESGSTEQEEGRERYIFALSQNYPNPFRGETVISYQSPVIGKVSLKIYDISGRLVRTLNLCNQNKSVKSVVWDGRDNKGRTVGSGIYFLKFEAGDYKKTLKLVKISR